MKEKIDNGIFLYTCVMNEQPYLKDWIEWHLNLGFTKIFIFEDLDSETHEDICKNYSDVILQPILSLFDDEEKPYVVKMKQEGKYRQTMYCKRAIMKIKEEYGGKWIASTDVDEFIELKDKTISLSDALDKYSDYDGILIKWHNYNSNGSINKPTYDKPIWEIYTTPCGHLKSDERNGHYTKVCYNMKRLNEKLIWGVHTIPSKNTVIVDDMWLNHYFTKSLEEWCDKLYKRGMFCKYRKIDDWFELNPDVDRSNIAFFLPTSMNGS